VRIVSISHSSHRGNQSILDALQSVRQRPERGEGLALAEGGGGGALMERHTREVEELRRGQQERVEAIMREHEEVVRGHEERMNQVLVANEAAEGELVARHAEERRAGQGGRPEAPECPVCFERMAPPTRIFQCRNGHLVCEACRSQLSPCICPRCREGIVGRATDTEDMIRSLFPSS